MRNGTLEYFAIPPGWSNLLLRDINDQGILLADATRLLDDQGQPIPPSQQSPEPVLLYPVELTSEDRVLKGAITIPEGWSGVSLGFRATAAGGQDLGTFSGLEPGALASSTFVYASEEDILTETELALARSGTLDPRATSQSVVFVRDATNPRRLLFATAFDQLGEIEITLSFGAGANPATAKLTHTLVAQAEAASLIATLDQRIETMTIPEVVDYDLDTDGDGFPDGGADDLVVASQPGTMSAPGPFVSEAAEDDPANLVLLINSDDDDADGQADSLRSELDATDDDLASITLRAPAGLTPPFGTLALTHDGGPALRLRFATGPPVASGATVNLASPAGPLAALAAGPLTLYAEGLAPATDVAITLAYTPAGASSPTVTDTVHLTVLAPAALAALEARHRYFALPGDLGGLASRSYAANGAYRQYRLGLQPIGENLPIQNRNLLAKSMFLVIGNLRSTAAYYRGMADGFWLGLKSDWQGLQDTGSAVGSAISFMFVEDDAGRMARAVAVYDQIKEFKKAFAGIGPAQIPAIIGNMAATITRDLYTDAEAALGWEPLTPDLDPQVIAYMGGITSGFVGEQIAVALIPIGGQVTRITATLVPVLRSVVQAAKAGTRFVLPGIEASAKATSWVYRGILKALGSTDEARDALQGILRARRTASGATNRAVEVMVQRLRTRPDLFDEVIAVWMEWLPRRATASQIEALTRNYARLVELAPGPTDLSDDALKGWARLYGSISLDANSSAEKTRLLAKVFGAGNSFDASTFDKAGFDAVMKQLKQDFVMEGSQHAGWKSINSGLIYDQYTPTRSSPEGHRLTHVFAHTVTNYKPGTHSVFRGLRKDVLPLLDEAWSKRPSAPTVVAGGKDKYLISMGKPVGELGESRIYIVVEQNTSRVVSAFPVNDTFVPN